MTAAALEKENEEEGLCDLVDLWLVVLPLNMIVESTEFFSVHRTQKF